MKHTLKTREELRIAVAKWLLRNDIKLICCEGNELGEEFLNSFELPETEETYCETFVEGEQITVVFQSKVSLPAGRSVSGKAVAFVILHYYRALYDDFGNVYRYISLGYNY